MTSECSRFEANWLAIAHLGGAEWAAAHSCPGFCGVDGGSFHHDVVCRCLTQYDVPHYINNDHVLPSLTVSTLTPLHLLIFYQHI